MKRLTKPSGCKNILRYIIILCVLTAFAGFVQAKVVNLGTFGKTYPIVEEDMLTMLQKRLSKVDMSKVFTKKKVIEAFHRYEHKLSSDLPTVKKGKVYKVNTVYTLNRNIYDGRGNILYPKGYTFDPLNYITVLKTYVILDASDKRQTKWFRKSKYYQSGMSEVLITKGDVLSLENKWSMPIFYASKYILRRLDIKAVPSVVYEKNGGLYVKEIPVADN